MKDYNEKRRARASSPREFRLMQFTFKRLSEVPVEVLSEFHAAQTSAQAGGVDTPELADNFAKSFLECVERTCVRNDTGEEVDTREAWRIMVYEGDEYGRLGVQTLAEVVEDLVAGVTEVPTGEPSDSSDGSPTPETGTPSTGSSPSEDPALTTSTPVALSTPATPS